MNLKEELDAFVQQLKTVNMPPCDICSLSENQNPGHFGSGFGKWEYHKFVPGGPSELAVKEAFIATLAEMQAKAEQYDRLHTPEVDDFLSAVKNEALYQRERWQTNGDEGKNGSDWFWLVGYLAGKALHDVNGKRRHHCITAAAALLNWHAAEIGTYIAMRPGIGEESV